MTTTTPYGRRGVVLGTLAGALLLVAAAPGVAQDTDARWLPWLGCWEAVDETPAGVQTARPSPVEDTLLCVRPAGGPWVEMLTVVGGEVGSREMVSADGSQRESSREGCTGWDEAGFSGDAARVYVHSEHTCEGGIERTTSGLLAFVSSVEWIETRAVRVTGTGRSMAWIRRYRLASPSDAQAAGFGDLTTGMGLAVESARLAAASPADVDDVVDATAVVDAEAVKAWISEQNDPFDLDAARLVRMADAGVPGAVIDVVVAVSYPDRFVVADEAELAGDDYGARRGYGSRGAFGRYGYGYPYGYGYGYDPFGYGYGYGSGYGYGYGGLYGGYYPRVVVVEPRASTPQGRAVNGRGYTRGGRAGPASTGGSGRGAVSSGRGGSSGGSAAPSRGSSGSAPRTAKPRGGSGGS